MIRKFLCILFILICSNLFAYRFEFKHKKGDHYRTVTSSIQKAFVNFRQVATFDQGYKAILRVTEVAKDYARISGKYYYMAKPYGKKTTYQVNDSKIYESEFLRYKDGKITIAKKYFYPVVRDLPVFPKKDIKIGESWVGQGYESQDFTKIGIKDPFISPFKVRYRYLKDEKYKGKDCAVIEVFYYMDKTFPTPKFQPGMYQRRYRYGYRQQIRKPSYPRKAMGFFEGKIYWDKKAGDMIHYEGDYKFIYVFSDGLVREWLGHDNGDVTLIRRNKKDEKKIQKEAKKEIGKIAQVKEAKEGIKLIFSDILFDFGKINLKPQVLNTLDKVAKILKKYPKYEVRIEGHSDNIGSEQRKQIISTQRARAVADYLMKKGIDSKRLSFEGFSDRKPLVPNNSAADRAKNRRVEIYIITR